MVEPMRLDDIELPGERPRPLHRHADTVGCRGAGSGKQCGGEESNTENLAATTAVVPAKAGTHNHSSKKVCTTVPHCRDTAYRSPPSRGQHSESWRYTHPSCIKHFNARRDPSGADPAMPEQMASAPPFPPPLRAPQPRSAR